ncbi:MAG: sugar ABC transporter permease [Spirochaetes bacterium]|nr:sugar ABC transporter permease [Spirochaetota bacterium]
MSRIGHYAKKNHLLFVACTLGPVLALFAFIRIIPIIRTAYYSFTNYSLLIPKPALVGFRNYAAMLRDASFKAAFSNTALITFSCVIVTLSLALLFSVLLRRIEKSSALYEMIFFIPVITPWVPATVIWRWLFDPTFGIINAILSFLRLPTQSWLQQPDQVIYAIIIISIWKTLGYYMIIYSVGLKNIPIEFYEAATVDGAGHGRQFRHITMPLLKPIVLFSMIMASIQFFNTFTVAFVISSEAQGSPSYECKVLVWEIYRNGFSYYKMGYASAEAMVLLVFIMIVILIQFRLLRYETEY